MKILQIVTKRQYRGAELFAANLSAELIRLGHEVLFVGLYEQKEDVLVVDKAENLDLVKFRKGAFSFTIVKKLVQLINQVKPDIIQCNGSDTLKYAVVASFFVKKIPLAYRNISIISEWISNKPQKILYKNLFKRIAHVTSVGDEALSDFIKTYNYPIGKTLVIRRGIPIRTIDKLSYSQGLREKLGLDACTKIAIHVGNFSPEKNHQFLIDIFYELKKEHPSFKLVLVGNGVLYQNIESEIYERGLTENVFQLGFRKDIPELLAASDCLLLSSKIEGVPGVILEAATQKIPAIAINVGGVSEVLINEKTGYIINDFDRSEFKEKLVSLMLNDNLRLEFGENAFNLISKGFNPEATARQFESLYLNLIEDNKLRR